MAERPIIYCGESVRATLAKIKTQTRRTRGLEKVNKEPDNWGKPFFNKVTGLWEFCHKIDGDVLEIKCPYGVFGDRLWVREGWRCTGGGSDRYIIYKADGDTVMSFCGIDDGREHRLCVPEKYWDYWDRLVYESKLGCNWRSPIHMPKWVARLWLEITGIRVERVQDISDEDCLKEGITWYGAHDGGTHYRNVTFYQAFPEKGGGFTKAKDAFELLWDSLNAKRGYGWEANPWVWPIEYKLIEES